MPYSNIPHWHALVRQPKRKSRAVFPRMMCPRSKISRSSELKGKSDFGIVELYQVQCLNIIWKRWTFNSLMRAKAKSLEQEVAAAAAAEKERTRSKPMTEHKLIGWLSVNRINYCNFSWKQDPLGIYSLLWPCEGWWLVGPVEGGYSLVLRKVMVLVGIQAWGDGGDLLGTSYLGYWEGFLFWFLCL